MSKPAKTWDFTINNYTDTDVSMLKMWCDGEVGRMAVAKEVGEEGTPRSIHARFVCSRIPKHTM